MGATCTPVPFGGTPDKRRGFLGDISKVILDILGNYFTGNCMAFHGELYGVSRGIVWRAPL